MRYVKIIEPNGIGVGLIGSDQVAGGGGATFKMVSFGSNRNWVRF